MTKTPPRKSPAEAPPAPSAAPDAPAKAPANKRTGKAKAPPKSERDGTAALQPQGDQHRGEPVHPGVPLAPPGIVPESDVRVHSPSSAAPPREHGIVNEGLGELPQGYGDGRLVSLVRDPTTLFVYWDFSIIQIEQAFAGLGKARAVVKLWNARNGELVGETEVQVEARGWYLRDLPPGLELRAEMWAVGEKGARMLRAARPARLPPAMPSDQLEAFYLRLSLDQPLPKEGAATGARPLHYGGAAPAGWERRMQPRGSSLGMGFGGSPGAKLPWSATHLVPPGIDEGEKK
jgi:hypothetical protein